MLTYPIPLTPSLIFSGNSHLNSPLHVPSEHGIIFPESMTWLQRHLLNPVAKRLFEGMIGQQLSSLRDGVRAGLGLPPMSRTTLSNVPILVGSSWELVSMFSGIYCLE
jgi:hypothetical protein